MVKKARIVKSPYFVPLPKDHKPLCAGNLCLLGYTGAKKAPEGSSQRLPKDDPKHEEL